jgi:hypothetical protein
MSLETGINVVRMSFKNLSETLKPTFAKTITQAHLAQSTRMLNSWTRTSYRIGDKKDKWKNFVVQVLPRWLVFSGQLEVSKVRRRLSLAQASLVPTLAANIPATYFAPHQIAAGDVISMFWMIANISCGCEVGKMCNKYQCTAVPEKVGTLLEWIGCFRILLQIVHKLFLVASCGKLSTSKKSNNACACQFEAIAIYALHLVLSLTLVKEFPRPNHNSFDWNPKNWYLQCNVSCYFYENSAERKVLVELTTQQDWVPWVLKF